MYSFFSGENTMNILCGGEVLIDGRIHKDKAVIFDNKIRSVIPLRETERLDVRRIPFTGVLLPGFIDIHIHGAAGADVMDATPEALEVISRAIVKSGTTSFLATTMTMEKTHIIKSLDCVRSFMETQSAGAQCLGVHLEGPFINPAFCGAHEKKHIMKPSKEWIEPFLDIIKVITLAPEMDKDHHFIKAMRDLVVLSLGHSGATYEEAKESFESGIGHVTHCFNAMTGFHHREPGAAGAAMTLPVSMDIITDLVHIHPGLFSALIHLKGCEKLIAVTDSMRAAFLSEGEYDLGGQSVYVKDDVCRLEDGTLAGSVHRMDQALRNLIKYTDCTLPELSCILSTSAALLLGIDDHKGHIKPGYDADMVILENYMVKDVYVGGKRQ